MSEQLRPTPKTDRLDAHLSAFQDIYEGLTMIYQWEDRDGYFREMVDTRGNIHNFHVMDGSIAESIRPLEQHQNLMNIIEEDFSK